MIGNAVVQIEAAEPPVRPVQMHLFAQPSLGPDAEAITHKPPADQELGIDLRAAGVTVEVGEMSADCAQINKAINRAQQVVLRDVVIKRELVEQSRLSFLPWSHHRQSLQLKRIESATYLPIKLEFFNEIRRDGVEKLSVASRQVV